MQEFGLFFIKKMYIFAKSGKNRSFVASIGDSWCRRCTHDWLGKKECVDDK